MENIHISGIIKQFMYYKTVGDKAIQQLTFEEMNVQHHEESNSISAIIKHMVGNMLSRWTNFLTEDGEKPWREREQEFEATYTSKEELIAAWETGWKCLFDALSSIKDNDFGNVIYIRNEGHTVAEAIYRQLGHYPYHIGQMVWVGKLLKGSNWNSLSIPKGTSKDYNQKKFSKATDTKHFTDKL